MIHTATDSTNTLYWQHYGSASTNNPPAYLLHLQALHQHYHQYISTQSHLPGPLNAMADDTSRLWNLSDSELLMHFNSSYPQLCSWTICQPTSSMISAMISRLCKRRLPLELFLHMPAQLKTIGRSGLCSAKPSDWIQPSLQSKILSPSFKFTCNDIGPATSPPVTSQYKLEQWRTCYKLLAKCSLQWGPMTLA